MLCEITNLAIYNVIFAKLQMPPEGSGAINALNEGVL